MILGAPCSLQLAGETNSYPCVGSLLIPDGSSVTRSLARGSCKRVTRCNTMRWVQTALLKVVWILNILTCILEFPCSVSGTQSAYLTIWLLSHHSPMQTFQNLMPGALNSHDWILRDVLPRAALFSSLTAMQVLSLTPWWSRQEDEDVNGSSGAGQGSEVYAPCNAHQRLCTIAESSVHPHPEIWYITCIFPCVRGHRLLCVTERVGWTLLALHHSKYAFPRSISSLLY